MSSVKRSWISDDQREILTVVGTGVIYKQKIDKAVIETGLTKAQVEVGIFQIVFFVSHIS